MPSKRKLEKPEVSEPRRSARTASATIAPQAEAKNGDPVTKSVAETSFGTDDSVAQPTAKKTKSSSNKLKIGDHLTDVTLEDTDGKGVTLLSESKEHGIVLFSYPAASTPGCTSQACSYRDNYEQITSRGYKVFGISTDTKNAQAKFKSKQGFQYPLLSDPDKKLLSLLGGATTAKKTALRCHWVFSKGGILKAVEIGVKPRDCVETALKSIDKIVLEGQVQ